MGWCLWRISARGELERNRPTGHHAHGRGACKRGAELLVLGLPEGIQSVAEPKRASAALYSTRVRSNHFNTSPVPCKLSCGMPNTRSAWY